METNSPDGEQKSDVLGGDEEECCCDKAVPFAADDGVKKHTGGSFCLHMGRDASREASIGIIQSTLNVLPVHPKHISHVKGPYMEVARVDDKTFDVEIIHGFRAHFGNTHMQTKEDRMVGIGDRDCVLVDRQMALRPLTHADPRHIPERDAALGVPFTLDPALVHDVPSPLAIREGMQEMDLTVVPAARNPWEIDPKKIILGRRIAVGGFAEVFIGKYEGTVVAIKRLIDVDVTTMNQFKSEVSLLARLRHPNLILFMGYCATPELCIVTEFMQKGCLFNLIRNRGGVPLDLKLQKIVAVSVARGMLYLHSRSPPILHLDLKSPNILVDGNWRVKITDFGLSKMRHRTFVTTGATGGGTPHWMAPEVLRSQKLDEKADVYSYGVILWELLTGKMPWEGMNPMQVVGAVGFQGKRLEVPETGDRLLIDLFKRCCAENSADRPSFSEILNALDEGFGNKQGSGGSGSFGTERPILELAAHRPERKSTMFNNGMDKVAKVGRIVEVVENRDVGNQGIDETMESARNGNGNDQEKDRTDQSRGCMDQPVTFAGTSQSGMDDERRGGDSNRESTWHINANANANANGNGNGNGSRVRSRPNFMSPFAAGPPNPFNERNDGVDHSNHASAMCMDQPVTSPGPSSCGTRVECPNRESNRGPDCGQEQPQHANRGGNDDSGGNGNLGVDSGFALPLAVEAPTPFSERGNLFKSIEKISAMCGAQNQSCNVPTAFPSPFSAVASSPFASDEQQPPLPSLTGVPTDPPVQKSYPEIGKLDVNSGIREGLNVMDTEQGGNTVVVSPFGTLASVPFSSNSTLSGEVSLPSTPRSPAQQDSGEWKIKVAGVESPVQDRSSEDSSDGSMDSSDMDSFESDEAGPGPSSLALRCNRSQKDECRFLGDVDMEGKVQLGFDTVPVLKPPQTSGFTIPPLSFTQDPSKAVLAGLLFRRKSSEAGGGAEAVGGGLAGFRDLAMDDPQCSSEAIEPDECSSDEDA